MATWVSYKVRAVSLEMSRGGKLQGLVQGGEFGKVQGDPFQAGFGAAQLGPRMPPKAWTDAQAAARNFVACETVSQEICVGYAGHGHQSIARKFASRPQRDFQRQWNPVGATDVQGEFESVLGLAKVHDRPQVADITVGATGVGHCLPIPIGAAILRIQ